MAFIKSKCLKYDHFRSVEQLREAIRAFVETWNEFFAHPFTWSYTGAGLHAKAVRRFCTLLAIQTDQMDCKFLTSQLLLMSNIADNSLDLIPAGDWLKLINLAVEKDSYITNIIDTETKPRRRKKAREAYDRFAQSVICAKTTSGRNRVDLISFVLNLKLPEKMDRTFETGTRRARVILGCSSSPKTQRSEVLRCTSPWSLSFLRVYLGALQLNQVDFNNLSGSLYGSVTAKPTPLFGGKHEEKSDCRNFYSGIALDHPFALSQIQNVKSTGGQLQGVVVDGVASYKGIPFAAPPVGDLRWKAPQSVRRAGLVSRRRMCTLPAACRIQECLQDDGICGKYR